jgi:hypothetical protein
MDDSELMFYDSKIDTWKSFAFDRVWKADKNQVDVFADVEPVIISVAGTQRFLVSSFSFSKASS